MLSRPYLLSLLVLVPSIACADQRVSVGEVEELLDLAECFGEGTRCEPQTVAWSIPLLNSIEYPEKAATCVPSEGDPWHIAWRQSLTQLSCAPLERCTARAVSVAADGSVWIAGLGATPIANSEASHVGILLMHLDRDGQLIARRVVATRRIEGEFASNPLAPGAQHALSIAADARGHVFVAVAWNERRAAANQATTTASISEYDSDAESVGDSVGLLGVSANMELSLSIGSSLILAASESGGPPGGGVGSSRMAAFGPGLAPVWVQSSALPGASPKSALAKAERVALYEPVVEMRSDLRVSTLEHYHGGNPVRVLRSTTNILPFAIDADANMLLLDEPNLPVSNVRKIGPEGETLSSLKVVRLDEPGIASEFVPQTAVNSDGHIYLLREAFPDRTTTLISRLVEVDAAIQNCVTSDVHDYEHDPDQLFRDTSTIVALFVTDAGEVYFQTLDLFARLTR